MERGGPRVGLRTAGPVQTGRIFSNRWPLQDRSGLSSVWASRPLLLPPADATLLPPLLPLLLGPRRCRAGVDAEDLRQLRGGPLTRVCMYRDGVTDRSERGLVNQQAM